MIAISLTVIAFALRVINISVRGMAITVRVTPVSMRVIAIAVRVINISLKKIAITLKLFYTKKAATIAAPYNAGAICISSAAFIFCRCTGDNSSLAIRDVTHI
jgi:hypothetical protein